MKKNIPTKYAIFRTVLFKLALSRITGNIGTINTE